jgi:hypothetical protein
MSAGNIAAWLPDELSFHFTDTDTHNGKIQTPATTSWASADPSLVSVSAGGSVAGHVESGFLSELHNADIRADVADALGANDSLTYHGVLDVLREAAAGGMTASKFGTLKALVSLMNAPDGISTSAYVEHISQSLVDGDPANATWTGGAKTAEPLGDLCATSTRKDVHELIGKWFLGTDLPSLAHTGSTKAAYEAHDGPLLAADGAPSYHNVNQGDLGDCYFLATLAEVALQDPSAIESMITNNGNGTYGVRFFVGGEAEYVTVNDELPTASKPLWDNGSNLKFANGADGAPLWAELVEKAFAQLNAEPGAIHGQERNEAINAYAGISDGHPRDALAEITGQNSETFGPGKLVSDAVEIGAAFESGEEVELFLGNFPKDYQSHGLVENHVFEVIGYNASSDAFTLHNPWGSASRDPMTFTMSAQELKDAGCYMTVAQGTASGAHATAYADADAHAAVEASLASVIGANHGPVGHFLL